VRPIATDVVCLSVYWSHGCAMQQTAEPIEMPFGAWLLWIQRTMY